ncbi:MAG: adenosylcobinamide-GDP ribazoletransferase [Alphaproteobacteria bacterium]
MNELLQKLDVQLHDIWAGFSLLTRLPVPVDHARAGERGAGAAWAYPVVGLLVGGLAGGVAAFLIWIGVNAGMAAAAALAILAISTGGMHEDGLADFADGVGGGKDKAHALEIMRDSRIGAFGAIAIGIALLARWSGIGAFEGWQMIAAIGAIGAASRAGMVLLMFALPLAKESGLSASAGAPPLMATTLAILIAFLACVLLTGISGVLIFALTLGGTLPVIWLARSKLGGQTGDVLGAAQQSAEIAGLAAALALIT